MYAIVQFDPQHKELSCYNVSHRSSVEEWMMTVDMIDMSIEHCFGLCWAFWNSHWLSNTVLVRQNIDSIIVTSTYQYDTLCMFDSKSNELQIVCTSVTISPAVIIMYYSSSLHGGCYVHCNLPSLHLKDWFKRNDLGAF